MIIKDGIFYSFFTIETIIPENQVGDACSAELPTHGIDTEKIVRKGESHSADYNGWHAVLNMRVKTLHPWDLSRSEAERVQKELSIEVLEEDTFFEVKIIGGVDVAYKGDSGRAACVVLSFPDLRLIEYTIAEGQIKYPYIPGLLSFREIPLLIPALEKLTTQPDLIIADGQGVAHPRGFGLASHLGVLLDRPVIGCAKSPLTGCYREPAVERGKYEFIYDQGRVIGAVVRTRARVRPIFVSVGHKISLKSAIYYTLQCTCERRIPEPVRYAHTAASGNTRIIKKAMYKNE